MARDVVIWELEVAQKRVSISCPQVTFLLSMYPTLTGGHIQQVRNKLNQANSCYAIYYSLPEATKHFPCRSNSEHHVKCILKAFLNAFLLWAILGENPTDRLIQTSSWKPKKCYWIGT